MKLITEEEQKANFNETVKGGVFGGVGGLAFGAAGVYAASVRYPAFRQLTLPLRAFLITSSGTFGAIVAADSFSRAHERAQNPDYQYKDEQKSIEEEAQAQKSGQQRTMDWLSDNRYSIVFGSWVASMGIALGIVGRNPYQTAQQKLVQARMWAQGLTIGVVVLSLAFETHDSSKGRGRWETVQIIDPNDPEHKRTIEKQIHHESYAGEDQWRDMVEAEEEKMKEREEYDKKQHPEKYQQKGKNGNGKGKGKNGGGEEKKGEETSGGEEKKGGEEKGGGEEKKGGEEKSGGEGGGKGEEKSSGGEEKKESGGGEEKKEKGKK